MKYAAFDMDGTLYDCGGFILESYSRGLERFKKESGIAVGSPSIDAIRSVLGMTADNFFSRLFPGTDPVHYPAIDRILTDELSRDVRAEKGILYSGVTDLLADISSKGWSVMIASNGQLQYLNAIIETYELSPYLVHGAQPVVVNYKEICTKSDILKKYAADLGIDVNSDRFVMVGDRASDLKAARDNRAYFIGCAFGHADDREIKESDSIVHSFAEVDDILSGF